MFTASLFTKAKKWKQPKCLSMNEWIKNMWYIYKMGTSFNHKKKGCPAICNNMVGL